MLRVEVDRVRVILVKIGVRSLSHHVLQRLVLVVLVHIEVGGHESIVDREVVCNGCTCVEIVAGGQNAAWVSVGRNAVHGVHLLRNCALVDNHDEAGA